MSKLSGGEKARIVLARLMLQPADLLVLDEPTNDLDIPTLDVLEESLQDFPGALVLVTHDRLLLDRIATQVLALDGKGNAAYFADYSQALSSRASSEGPGRAAARESKPKEQKRLTYLEQREYESIEATLQAAEQELEEARKRSEDPSIATDAEALQRRFADLDEARKRVDRLYHRWSELEAKVT